MLAAGAISYIFLGISCLSSFVIFLLSFVIFLLQFLIFLLRFLIFFLLFLDFAFFHKNVLQQSYYEHLIMLQFFHFCQKLWSPALSVDKDFLDLKELLWVTISLPPGHLATGSSASNLRRPVSPPRAPYAAQPTTYPRVVLWSENFILCRRFVSQLRTVLLVDLLVWS